MTSISPHLDDVPPLKILKLDTDPIAVSCYMHDNRLTNYTEVFTYADLDQSVKRLGPIATLVLAATKDKYQKQAQEIRNYYSYKFTMMLMRSTNPHTLTRFRKQLLEFLTFTDNEFTMDHVGMIASLPRMYKEDSILEDLKDCFNNSPWEDREPHGKEIELDLTYVDHHSKRAFKHAGRTRDEWLCYWCHDENDRLYMIEMDYSCPFRNFWANSIEHTFRIKGSPIKHEAKDGMRYYTLVDWQIL